MSIDNAHNMAVSNEDALREAALQAALREAALLKDALRQAALSKADLQAAHQAAIRGLVQRATDTNARKNNELEARAEQMEAHAKQMAAKDKELKDQAKWLEAKDKRLEAKDKELKAKDKELKAKDKELEDQYKQIATLEDILSRAKDYKTHMDWEMTEKESLLSNMQRMHQEVNAAYTAELTRLNAEIATLKETVIFNDKIFEIACGIIDRAIVGQDKLRTDLPHVITLDQAMELLQKVITFSLNIPPTP